MYMRTIALFNRFVHVKIAHTIIRSLYMSCERPRISNSFLYPFKDSYNYGETISVQCGVGFYNSGIAYATCIYTGWTNLPRCYQLRTGDDDVSYLPIQFGYDEGIVEDQIVEDRKCSSPPFPEGKILNSKEYFNEGDTIKFECKSGFIMTIATSSTCMKGGQWTQIPICKPRSSFLRCQQPEITDAVINPLKLFYTHGDSITIQCSTGFTLSGLGFAKCTHHGWETLPFCQESASSGGNTNTQFVYAPAPINRHNYGIINENHHLEKEHPHIIEDVEIAKPQYVGLHHENRGRKCNLPPFPAGRILNWKREYAVGDSLILECDAGFIMAGGSSVQCMDGGIWGEIPECKLRSQFLRCEKPVIDNAIMNPLKLVYTHGDTINVKCMSGFTLEGLGFAKCSHLGWEILPKCQRIEMPHGGQNSLPVDTMSNQPSNYPYEDLDHKCASPPFAQGKIVNPKLEYNVGESIQFECEPGTVLSGGSSARCTQGGIWSEIPSCRSRSQFLRCERPTIANSMLNPSKIYYTHGDSVVIRCADGFAIKGIGFAKCSFDGWGELPDCISSGPVVSGATAPNSFNHNHQLDGIQQKKATYWH